MSIERIQVEGNGHTISIAEGGLLGAPVLVRGSGNSLILGPGATVSAYALSGPAGLLAVSSPEVPCLVIEGEDNSITIEAGCRLGLSMAVRGNGNRVHIGADCQLNGLISIPASGALLTIGQGTTMVRGSIQMHESAEIVIGRDCMISSDVYLSVSDIHPIHDAETGVRLNPAGSIRLGDHVWLGLRCMVMKGSLIEDGAVVAAGAVVAGRIEAGAVAAGIPARVVRRGVVWARDFDAAGPSAEAPTVV